MSQQPQSPQDLLNANLTLLMAFDSGALKHSSMPLEWLNRWITRIIDALNGGDRDLMVARNIDATLIDTLPVRLSVYLFCAAKRANAEQAESDLKLALDDAHSDFWPFIGQVRKTMDLALRKDEKEKKNLKDIKSGNGIENAIDDLRRYHEIVTRKPQPFAAINEDPTALASELWARQENLSKLKAAADNAPEMTDEEKELMFRAYTWLDEAVSEIVEFATFLFDEGSEELDPYIPEYYRQIGKMGAKVTNSQSEENEEDLD